MLYTYHILDSLYIVWRGLLFITCVWAVQSLGLGNIQ